MYQWLLGFHIIAVIAWMAGMLYLPRLFVYHCEADPGSRQSETFKVMERRLLKAIINPAMIVTWVLGLWLAWKRRLVRRALAARQARPGAGDERRARHPVEICPRIRRRPAPEIREILPDSQRGTDRPLDPHRDPRGGQTVLIV